MPVLSVSYVNYRNLENAAIDLLSKEVYFVGENGQGKSNLLESIYYSAYGSSFRTHADAELIKNGEKSFSVKTFHRDDETGSSCSIFVTYENGKKKIEKNGKTLKDRKDLITTMPCVLFCHDDLDFATGEPEKKRFFIDQCLSMYDVLYIDVMRRYKKILKSRNLSLKEKQYQMLDVYDMQLVHEGVEIQRKRSDTIFKFNQIFGKLYEQITGIEGVSIKYDPSWNTGEINPTEEDALRILSSKREMDRVIQTTMSGPHRDKIKFMRHGANFVPTASTGQRRLLAILLRVAQAIYFTCVTEKKPILLMDDVLLELDPDKRQSVTANLPEYDQLFCTFLPGEPYERYKKSTTRIYKIEKGSWQET